MDVVLVDIPLKFGMLLSIYWETKLKGALHMDMLYATIHVFRIQRRIFKEKKLAYMVTNAERPHNHPIYSLEMEMGSTILFTKGGKYICSSQKVAFMPTQEKIYGVRDVSFDRVA